MPMTLKVGYDLDDTINEWYQPYLDRFGIPKNDYEITKNVHKVLSKDKEFWLSLPIKHRPGIEATLYCTKRIIPKSWIKQYLVMNNLTVAPIYQVFCQASPKSPRIKGRLDLFIDDSISNFIEMNLNGVPCLLIDSPENQSWGPVGRIFSLEKDEIESAYIAFKENIFPNFKQLIYERRNS